jgi:hypothetical protein
VLRDDAFVLHRHLPAGEGNHPRAGGHVALVERSLGEGLHAVRTLTVCLRNRSDVAVAMVDSVAYSS